MKSFRTMLILSACALLALGGCSNEPSGEGAEAPAEAENAEPAESTEAVDYDDLKGDAAAGEAAFAQCKVCHGMEEGKVGIGPSLHKVIGRTAGTVPGYSYSSAMKSSGITWSEEKLFEFFATPQASVPGTKMSFAGYPDAQKRADLIAWLKANGGS